MAFWNVEYERTHTHNTLNAINITIKYFFSPISFSFTPCKQKWARTHKHSFIHTYICTRASTQESTHEIVMPFYGECVLFWFVSFSRLFISLFYSFSFPCFAWFFVVVAVVFDAQQSICFGRRQKNIHNVLPFCSQLPLLPMFKLIWANYRSARTQSTKHTYRRRKKRMHTHKSADKDSERTFTTGRQAHKKIDFKLTISLGSITLVVVFLLLFSIFDFFASFVNFCFRILFVTSSF